MMYEGSLHTIGPLVGSGSFRSVLLAMESVLDLVNESRHDF